MKLITVKIPDKKFRFFMELIKSLDFVKVEEERDFKESPYDPEFVDRIKRSENEFEEGSYTTVDKKDLKNPLGW